MGGSLSNCLSGTEDDELQMSLVASEIGLAYVFDRWLLDDGTTCEPGGVRLAPAMTPAEAQAAVDAQAAEVRRLKEEEDRRLPRQTRG